MFTLFRLPCKSAHHANFLSRLILWNTSRIYCVSASITPSATWLSLEQIYICSELAFSLPVSGNVPFAIVVSSWIAWYTDLSCYISAELILRISSPVSIKMFPFCKCRYRSQSYTILVLCSFWSPFCRSSYCEDKPCWLWELFIHASKPKFVWVLCFLFITW